MSTVLCKYCRLPMLDNQSRVIFNGEWRHSPWQCIELLRKELDKAQQVDVRDVYAYEAGLDEGRRECSESLLAAIIKQNRKSGWQVVHVEGEWKLGGKKDGKD